MDDDRIRRILDYYRQRYPQLISFDQAAEIAIVAKDTIYSWSSAGEFDGFKFVIGRYKRLALDDFVLFLLSAVGQALLRVVGEHVLEIGGRAVPCADRRRQPRAQAVGPSRLHLGAICHSGRARP